MEISKNDRRKARVLALQILYSHEQNPGLPLKEQMDGILEMEDVDVKREGVILFARELVQKTLKAQAIIDELLSKYTQNWSLERISTIDRNILRLAVSELTGEFGTPLRVVINEAVEIAKLYGTDDSAKFVNGVIDAIKIELTYTE